MITTIDIPLLVAFGEGYNVEFKNAVPSKVKELSEEVCAFANAAGGVLLIGVSDSNTINGVRIDNAKRSAIQTVGENVGENFIYPMRCSSFDSRVIIFL